MSVRLFEVGGSIRDLILGADNKDRDFCAEVSGGWNELLDWCNSNMTQVFLTQPEFFTIRGFMGDQAIDIVMCRREGNYEDGRHPSLVEPGTLHDDLARRDFTMNAIACEVNHKLRRSEVFIDPFNGEKDAKSRILRSVGNVQDRFDEDGLRLLRAVRFLVTKDLSMDHEIREVLLAHKNWIHLMDTVSEERIREELNRMFKFNCTKSLSFIARHCNFAAWELFSNDRQLWLKSTLEKK